MLQSDNWPNESEALGELIVEYDLVRSPSIVALRAHVANNVESLRLKLDVALYALLTLVSITTLAASIATRRILWRSFITPLETLARHAKYIHEDKARMGEQVTVDGDHEMRQVATTINLISTELRNLYGTLRYMAYTDSLTQLPNRLQLNDSLTQLITVYRERGLDFAPFMIDVDRVKHLDNTRHRPGEYTVIQHISARLSNVFRSTDLVFPVASHGRAREIENIARLDGDDFAVLLPDAGDCEQAMLVAENALNGIKAPTIDEHLIAIEVNIGIALYPKHATDVSGLLHCASMAVFEAKRQGSNVHVYNSE